MTISYASEWVRLQDAAVQLGLSVSTVYRLRREGVLLRGVHWHRGRGRRSAVQINVPAARLALQVWCSR